MTFVILDKWHITALLIPVALRKAKIVCNFGLFECKRVKKKLITNTRVFFFFWNTLLCHKWMLLLLVNKWVHFQGKQLYHLYFCLPSQFESTLIEKTLLFLKQIWRNPFRRSHKNCSLSKNGRCIDMSKPYCTQKGQNWIQFWHFWMQYG